MSAEAIQLGLVIAAPDSIFDKEDYSPVRDMTCQPRHCECGAAYRRDGGYLFCKSGHERGAEPVGREDHPRNAEWEAYLEANGRDAFERAVDRHIAQRRRGW